VKKTKGTADGDEAAAAAEAEPAVEGKGRKKDFTDKVWAAMSDEAKNAHIKANQEARAKENLSQTQVYVSNLPTGASSERLQAAFEKFGEISDAFIPHRGSRFGFVDFKEPASATKAMEAMHQKVLDAESKEDTPDETIGVVRATKRPASKERKEPEAPKGNYAAAAEKGAKGAKGAKGGKGEGRREKERAPARNSTHTNEEPRNRKSNGINKRALDAVADKLFKALSEQNWDSAGECFAPGAKCFSPQRSGAKAQDFPGFKKTMGGMIGLLGKPQYLNVQRLYGPDSVTEQHTTRFSENESARVEAEVCVLLRVNEAGLIVRMDEYLDPTVVLKAVKTASGH